MIDKEEQQLDPEDSSGDVSRGVNDPPYSEPLRLRLQADTRSAVDVGTRNEESICVPVLVDLVLPTACQPRGSLCSFGEAYEARSGSPGILV